MLKLDLTHQLANFREKFKKKKKNLVFSQCVSPIREKKVIQALHMAR